MKHILLFLCTLFCAAAEAGPFSGCKGAKSVIFVKSESDWLPYKECSYVETAINIQASDFKSLKIFSNLRRVKSLEIRDNPQLETLAGLENLNRIDDYLVVDGGAKLSDIQSLKNIKFVGDSIAFGFMNEYRWDKKFKGFPLVELKNLFKETAYRKITTFERDEFGLEQVSFRKNK